MAGIPILGGIPQIKAKPTDPIEKFVSLGEDEEGAPVHARLVAVQAISEGSVDIIVRGVIQALEDRGVIASSQVAAKDGTV